MTLREVVKALSKEQQTKLIFALENDMTDFIEVGDGMVVGVNMKGLPQFTIFESHNNWSYGALKRE